MAPDCRNAYQEQLELVSRKDFYIGHDPAGKHERHPSVDRQNEGIEDSAKVRMILLDMRGLLPLDEWGTKLAVIKREDVTFAIPNFTQNPHKLV